MGSNHRRLMPADLQSAPFGRSGIPPFHWTSETMSVSAMWMLTMGLEPATC